MRDYRLREGFVMEITVALIVMGGLVLIVGMFLFKKSSDGSSNRIVKQASDDTIGSGGDEARAPLKTNVAKTAQLAQLKERLADAQAKGAASSGAGPSTAKRITPGIAKQPVQKQPTKPAVPDPSQFAKTLVLSRDDMKAMAAGAPPGVSSEKPWSPEDSGLPNPLVSFVAEKAKQQQSTAASENHSPVESGVNVKVASSESANASPAAPAPTGSSQEPSSALPVEPPASVEQPAPLPQDEPPHVLLVDDSKVVRVKTEKLLLSKGFRVSTAIDGIDALSRLETFKPDLIITDIEMPNLDGFGLVRNIRNNLRTSDIPIIVMTSHVNLHLDIAATEGINGFLPKPFNEQDLVDQVSFLTSQ